MLPDRKKKKNDNVSHLEKFNIYVQNMKTYSKGEVELRVETAAKLLNLNIETIAKKTKFELIILVLLTGCKQSSIKISLQSQVVKQHQRIHFQTIQKFRWSMISWKTKIILFMTKK